MSKKLGERELAVWEILRRAGVHSKGGIEHETGLVSSQIGTVIRSLRQRFLNGSDDVDCYIFTTQHGYSTDDKPEYVAYESRLRVSIGMGTLLNGVYCFKRCRRLNFREYKGIMVKYKTGLIETKKVFK